MTFKRAIPGYEQRLSRAFQFRPGHVGGRVASAQPVVRRDGSLRTIVGAGGAPPIPPGEPTYVYVYPDTVWMHYDWWYGGEYPKAPASGYLVGSTVKAALSDASDSTYVVADYRDDDGRTPPASTAFVFEWEPYTPPAGKIITGAALEFRAKLESDTEPARTSTEIRIEEHAHDDFGYGYQYHYGDFSHGDPVGLTDTFSDESFNAMPYNTSDMPGWLAALAAGGLQVGYQSYTYPSYDIPPPPDDGYLIYTWSMMRIQLTLVNG